MKERFRRLAQELGFKNQTALSRALGINDSYISQLIKAVALNSKFRENLKSRFPQTNLDYLEFGKGKPLLPDPPETPEERRERLTTAITEILNVLEPPAREVIFETIRKYQDSRKTRNADTKREK